MFRIGLLLLLASVGMASAQTKVAIINTNNAVLETAEIKKAQAELEAKYKPRQAQLEKLQKELADIQAQLQGGRVTQQQAADLQITGQRKQREYQRLGEDLQAEVDRERNDILQRAGGRMQEVIRKMAEERGLDVVIDVSNAIYFKPALDITKEAVAAYDKTHPAPATAAAAK